MSVVSEKAKEILTMMARLSDTTHYKKYEHAVASLLGEVYAAGREAGREEGIASVTESPEEFGLSANPHD